MLDGRTFFDCGGYLKPSKSCYVGLVSRFRRILYVAVRASDAASPRFRLANSI